MKIVDVRAYPLRITDRADEKSEGHSRPPTIEFGDYYVDRSAFTSIYSHHHETTVIRVETDTGIVGWGEAQSPISPNTTTTIVHEIVRPLVMGRDPFDIEAIWTRNYGAMRERGHPTGFYIDAIGGTDIALWDIVGKAIGKPVHKIAGGRYRDEILLYAGMGGTDPEKVADTAEEHLQYGYKAFKLHLLLDVEGVAEICRAVRKRVGPKIMLMVDTHMRQTVVNSILLGRELEKLNFTWLESPTVPDDIPGQAEITRALDMAVAIGEWTRTRYEMREQFERHPHARHRSHRYHRRTPDRNACRHLQYPRGPTRRRRRNPRRCRHRRVVGFMPQLHDHGTQPPRQRRQEPHPKRTIRTRGRLLQSD